MRSINSIKEFLLTLLLLCMVFEISAQKIKVACIGDSVTFGLGIVNSNLNSYPAQLQHLLGSSYEVGNFGYSGATLLKNGHKPYWEKPEFKKSQTFNPDIVIIHLGLNDQGNNNWPKHKEEFIQDYLDLIKVYKNLPSNPKVIICKMTPTYSGHHWFEEGMRESFKEIQSNIEEIAKTTEVDLINLHTPLYKFPEYFPDNLHPTKEGATVIAQKVYTTITGDYGGLQIPKIYGEKMVLQRNEPIVFTGIANENEEVQLTLNQHTKIAIATNGSWKIEFPAMKAGGPFSMTIRSDQSETIHFNEVYVGEVWLASGQSNMDFSIHQSKSAETVLKDSLNPNIFLFSMDGKVLSPTKFTAEEHALCNANDYFHFSGWSNENDPNFKNFSAVAYSFAYNLQKELNIPIGIICNAIGGSPTQSWISRAPLEQDHTTISLLNNTWQHPLTNTWSSNRKVVNFGGANKLTKRHPYDPTFLFDAGISPLQTFNIAGIIWYQGESNAEQIDLHSNLFKLLIDDWRMQWNKPDLSFYYVQLSSLNRANWGAFRDSQRKLLCEIANTGMIVSSDIGHETDVHPKQKWILGHRLSKVALAKTYDKNLEFSGPLLDHVKLLKNKLEVHFKHANGLKTSNGKTVQDIQIAGKDGVFVAASTSIETDKLIVWSDKIKRPRFVRYGYTSFTTGNLVNASNLPASTFSNTTD